MTIVKFKNKKDLKEAREKTKGTLGYQKMKNEKNN